MDATPFGLLPRPVQGTFAEAWASGCEGPLRALFAGSFSNGDGKSVSSTVSASQLYSALYHLCVATPADHMLDVYTAIATLFADEANAACVAIERACNGAIAELGDVSGIYASEWQRYSLGVERTDAVCLYVNRVIAKLVSASGKSSVDVYVDGRTPTPVAVRSVASLGVAVWRTAVKGICPRVIDPIIAKMTYMRTSFERDIHFNAANECNVLSAAIRSFSWRTVDDSEDAYVRDLEPAVLAATERFYGDVSRRALFDSSSPETCTDVASYAAFAERMLRAEERLWSAVGIDAAAAGRILETVRCELLTAHSPLLERALEEMLDAAVNGDAIASTNLAQVHAQLSSFQGGAAPFGRALRACIASQCRRSTSTGDAVAGILAVYAWVRRTISDALSGCERCTRAADEAVTAALAGMPNVDIASLLAQRMHSLLVHGEAAGGNALSDAVCLAALVPDTDAFSHAYGRLLAARLVFRSAHGVSPAAEPSMVAGLQGVVGADAAVRWRRMLADAHASAMLADTFRAEWATHSGHGTVQPPGVAVASYVVWPLDALPTDHLALYAAPEDLLAVQEKFGQMYARVWPNRRLTWLDHLARAIVVWRSSKNPSLAVEMIVSVPQARALALFVAQDTLPLSAVVSALWGSPEPSDAHIVAVLSVLAPLFAAGVLIRDGDVVRAASPTISGQRLVLAQPTLDAPSPPALPEVPSVLPVETHDGGPRDDRERYALQAHLVRIFKTHRELSLQRAAQLVRGEDEGVASATDVSRISTRAIGTVLEQLVDKEYVEKDMRSGLYRYMP